MFVNYAIKEIRRRKIRSIINIIGYAIAVSFLIVIVSLAQSYNVVASGELRGIGTHFVAYIPASTGCPCEFGDVGPFFADVYTPTFSSNIVDKVENLSGVEDAAPYLMFRVDNYTIAGIDVDSLATRTTAVSPETLVAGTFLTNSSLDGVLVNEAIAEVLNLKVGDELSAFNSTFIVVGVVNPGLFSKPAGNANIFCLLSVAQDIAQSYGNMYHFSVNEINAVLVEISAVGDENYLNNVKKAALDKLEFEVGDEGVIAGYQCGVKARKVVSLTETSAWVSSVVLIVAAIAFSLRSQLGAVIERTKEIGLLKALGWKDGDVTKQIFFESLFQGMLGGIIGVIVGYLVILLIVILGLVPLQNLVFAVPPWLLWFGFILSTGGGVIAGLIPAWRAAKLQPAEALRRF